MTLRTLDIMRIMNWGQCFLFLFFLTACHSMGKQAMEKADSQNAPLFTCLLEDKKILCEDAPKASSYRLTLATRSFSPRMKWETWKTFTNPTAVFELSDEILQKKDLVKWVVTAHDENDDAFARTFVSSIGGNSLSAQADKNPFFTITDPEPGETFRFEDDRNQREIEFTWSLKSVDVPDSVFSKSFFLEVKKWRADKAYLMRPFTVNSQNKEDEFSITENLEMGRYRAQVVLKTRDEKGQERRYVLSLPISFSVITDHLPIQKF